MKYLLVLAVLIAGCSPIGYLEKLPNTAFKSFEYHRGGNVTSATIIAKDALVVDGDMVVGSVSINADYGPFFNVSMKLEGFERDVSK